MGRPFLCTLPLEITQAILCHLPDLETLQSTVFAHPALSSAFTEHKEYILHQILSHTIPPELLPDAILAFNASTIEADPWTRERVLSILDEHKSRQIPPSFRLTVKTAFSMQTLHRQVHAFTSEFLSTALSQMFFIGFPSSVSPSYTEECRTARSFYRFEIHQHLFRMREPRAGFNKPSPDFRLAEQWNIHYRHYPVWEVEQLMSVCDFLFRTIARPFREIAERETEWSDEGIWYVSGEACHMDRPSPIGTLLAHGLVFLGRVLAAPTYAERYQLLAPKLLGKPFISSLAELLPNICGAQPGSALWYNDLTLEQIQGLQEVEPPGFDSGPAEAWRWAHARLARYDWVGGEDTQQLRRRGYVFWDHDRLVDWGLLDQPWRALSPDLTTTEWRSEMMEANLEQRPNLYLVRGVGWWWAGGHDPRPVS
ncbi:hypothetical protein BO94DRAFT_593208 [Aspergillus sclerotioniger CBS 115572]|uniref:F-box domain-containing protein n=1 Tax=Aspergillus sclerotioniger CBS 115572 TaxID=1450535 RepID=A0A317WWG9_9EURO|nr:hypothetical protein BO94DRAFT_593208 [Aspergillus sclerotioniger CBS 115572]PWY90395.1 hypothetical protein BO94DRAFT_593208 [Aspergillus sclerotioniger CBS 115572]